MCGTICGRSFGLFMYSGRSRGVIVLNILVVVEVNVEVFVVAVAGFYEGIVVVEFDQLLVD